MRNKNLQLFLTLLLLLLVVHPALAFQDLPPPVGNEGLPIDGFVSFFIAIGAFLGFRFFNKKEK